MATAEEKKQIFRRFAEEAWNKGNLDVVYETFSDDYHAHASDPAYDVFGAKGHAEFIGTFRAAFPDVKVHFEHLLSSGDLLVANMWWSGTHRNDYMGLPGTGRSVSVHVIGLNRFEGDKVVEGMGCRRHPRHDAAARCDPRRRAGQRAPGGTVGLTVETRPRLRG